ncbi:putative ribonuclease H-like domain-containing protein [Tanacetum coccineum]
MSISSLTLHSKQEDTEELEVVSSEIHLGLTTTSQCDQHVSEEEERLSLMACNTLKLRTHSESETQTSDFDTCESDCSVETHESLPEPTVNEPKVVNQPKVWSDAPIIEEYESDSEDEHVSQPTKEQEQPSFASTNKQVKTPRETVKNQFTHSKNLIVDKKGLGHGFTARAFNTARASGTNNVSTARHNFNSQTILTNDARKISIVKPVANRVKSKTVFHKTHSPFSRPFINTTALKTNFSYQKINIVEVNAVSAVGGKGKMLALKHKEIVDSGCSRHMTGNKAYLAEYQDFNGGPVAFGGSKMVHNCKGPQEANHNADTQDNIDAGDSEKEDESAQDYFVLPIWSSYSSTVKRSTTKDAGEAPTKHPDLKTDEKPVDKEDQEFAQEIKNLLLQAGAAKTSSTNIVNTASTPVSTDNPYDGLSFSNPTNPDQDDSEIPTLDHIPTSRINSIHPSTLILGDPQSAVQTRSKVTKSSGAYAFVSYVQKQRRNNHKDFQHCFFACFLSQNEPKKISEALEDESWVDAMQEELLKFKIQKVWILVDLPYGKKTIGTKLVYRNKKDERGVVVRNKARLVAQGHRQEEGIDYDEVFAPMARIEAIRIFLAFASYMGFIVYQMDVKSAFLYDKIDKEVYVSQPPGFIDPTYPQKNRYRRGTIDKTLFIKKDNHDIILVQVYVDDIIFGSTKKSCQDKYVAKILKKFNFVNIKTASTPIETRKPLVKDEEASDVDVHLYRSMIGSLMYFTASRPDIMYLKGKPKLGLWYPRVSLFNLEAYSDSDYAGANIDRKSTTGEAEYVTATNCCGQVFWIQNQMLDYGFNFMNTKIYIDNESTICIVKNPVYHSKTKHIAIRHHFIRDAYEKKLIQVLKIYTDDNVADLLTKAFDVSSF